MAEDITLEQFEEEATAFLEANARRREPERFSWGQGPDSVTVIRESTPEEDRRELSAARQWANLVFDAGFGWLTGPVELGGRGLDERFERSFQALAAQFVTPSLAVFGIGLGMVAPTIEAHGSDEVKQRYLRAMHRGDVVGCQMFSEPGAGSDLAGLQTRAVRDGNEWVVTGQKVWTSYAHLADIGEVVCRSDPDLPKHRGLTALVIDMHAPGVEVRPLRQMTGGSSFNEVFLSEVRVPDSHRLGEVNQGWSVALTTLMNERAAIGGGTAGESMLSAARLIELVRRCGRASDPLVRQQLARVIIGTRVAGYTNQRVMEGRAGATPGPELSLAKMALTSNLLATAQLVSMVVGPGLVADSGRWGTFAWGELVTGVPGMRVAGGTDEVLRNVVGERVLGLPKEPAATR